MKIKHLSILSLLFTFTGQGHQRLQKNRNQQNGGDGLKIESETCEPSVKKQPIPGVSIKNVKNISKETHGFNQCFFFHADPFLNLTSFPLGLFHSYYLFVHTHLQPRHFRQNTSVN